MLGFDRRDMLCALAACGASIGAGELAALPVRPRYRVIVDNDFSGDPDGLFQLAHHLASPSTCIPFVIGSHIHPGARLDPTSTQADNAVRRARELIDCMRLRQPPDLVAGRNAAGAPHDTPGPAAQRIVAEATREDPLPLFYAAGAGLTDLSEALHLEPRIARRLALIWIGGPDDTLPPGVIEYNLRIDPAAARHVFDSGIEVWQVPRPTYRSMIVSHAELQEGLARAGRLGRFLLAQVERAIGAITDNLAETFILGDSPLVTLTALQSSFDADAASSAYVVRPRPTIRADGTHAAAPSGRPMRVYTRIDARLTFADMFAKFRDFA